MRVFINPLVDRIIHLSLGLVKRLERGSKESQESDKTVVPTQFNIKKAKK